MSIKDELRARRAELEADAIREARAREETRNALVAARTLENEKVSELYEALDSEKEVLRSEGYVVRTAQTDVGEMRVWLEGNSHHIMIRHIGLGYQVVVGKVRDYDRGTSVEIVKGSTQIVHDIPAVEKTIADVILRLRS